ncbi:hypothetical protein, partial [Vibrio parahaemolyticus]|uniref:hypothetical protein n=1 Tax=Vibrio parahaemolyticus TaxID=670 RepID=UPI001BAEDDA7
SSAQIEGPSIKSWDAIGILHNVNPVAHQQRSAQAEHGRRIHGALQRCQARQRRRARGGFRRRCGGGFGRLRLSGRGRHRAGLSSDPT